MSEELVSQVKTEVERIEALPLDQQVNEFAALREELESVLNDSESNR
ncbi:MAG: hypothetical protein RIS66_827 [Actinomycetota bacterium]|jgi:hypothetical protein